MTPEIIAADPAWPYTKAKTAVLAAAAFVIRERGPRAATLKNIATKAGITEPAIFRHFEGIDGLFHGLFDAYERIYGRIGGSYDDKNLFGIVRFRQGILSGVDIIAASRDFSYILVHAEQVFRGYPELKVKVAEIKLKDQESILSALAEAKERGEVRSDVDAMSIVTSVLGMIYMTIIFWIESEFAFDLRALCETRIEDSVRLIGQPACE